MLKTTLLKKVTATTKPATKKVDAPTLVKPAAPRAPKLEVPLYKPKIDSDYMNAQQLEHFRAILEERKRLLMEQAEATMRDMQVANEENQADISDIATTEERWYYQLRTRDRERKLIKKIEESIQKIADKDYGYCESCGVEIGLQRLEVRPTATLCIDCKTLDEIREKTKAD